MQYGEPFTHTGMLASKPFNDNWTWYAGIVNGWNDFDCRQPRNFLGGVTYTDKDWGSLAFAHPHRRRQHRQPARHRTVRQPHDVQPGLDAQL